MSTSSDHCALLVFIAARSCLALSSSLGSHVVLAWIKDEARVTDIEEDRSESDHAMRLSAAYHGRGTGDDGTYTLSSPIKAPWSWNADPLYPSVNS